MFDKQRLVVAVLYGVGAVVAALQVSFPSSPEQWVGLAGVFLTAFWGKYSSSQTVLAKDTKQ